MQLATLSSSTGPPSSTLDRVLSTGVLRVGVTADYPPFSMDCGPAVSGVAGSDIDEAAALASTLNATPKLVLTTWSELVADQASGRFDVGVGGISATLERRRSVGFSAPILTDGKVLVTRCDSPLLGRVHSATELYATHGDAVDAAWAALRQELATPLRLA